MRLVVVLLSVALVACQPTIGPLTSDPTEQGSARPRLGAPDADGVPQSLPELLTLVEPEAVEWQDDPRLVQIEVELADEGTWASTAATYIAAEADRLLELKLTPDGLAEQRLTLSTLQLQPVPDEAVQAVPELPERAQEPADLAGVGDVSACLGARAATVLYATGAPFAWDGEQWTTEPSWSATVRAEEGPAAVVDPVSGALTDCLEG